MGEALQDPKRSHHKNFPSLFKMLTVLRRHLQPPATRCFPGLE